MKQIEARKTKPIISRAKEEGRNSLFEHEAELVASHYGIPVLKSALARNEREALACSRKIGYPVAMKIVSRDILHKSDVGGIELNLETPGHVRTAYREILSNVRKKSRNSRIEGVLIQKMARRPPFEFVVGGIRDKQFGPAVMFGLGGIYIEVFRDVTFRLAPLSTNSALRMIRSIKSSKLLEGFRGAPPLDGEQAARIISKVGKILVDNPEVDSIDINPLFIYPKGVVAADVRMILGEDVGAHLPKD